MLGLFKELLEIELDGDTLADEESELLGLPLKDIATVALVDAKLLDVIEGEPENESSAVAEIELLPESDGLEVPISDEVTVTEPDDVDEGSGETLDETVLEVLGKPAVVTLAEELGEGEIDVLVLAEDDTLPD